MCLCKVTDGNIQIIILLENFLAPDKGKKYSEVQKLHRKRKNRLGQQASDLDTVNGNYFEQSNMGHDIMKISDRKTTLPYLCLNLQDLKVSLLLSSCLSLKSQFNRNDHIIFVISKLTCYGSENNLYITLYKLPPSVSSPLTLIACLYLTVTDQKSKICLSKTATLQGCGASGW